MKNKKKGGDIEFIEKERQKNKNNQKGGVYV